MTETIVLLITLITLNFIDWRQTLDIVDNEKGIYETNRIMGKYPSEENINTYFAIVLPSQIITGLLLEKYIDVKYRNYFWIGCIGMEIGAVSKNYNLGLKVRF